MILGLSFTLNAFDTSAFKKACEAGNFSKCSILGEWYKNQAIKYGNLACDNGFAEGCNHIGDLYGNSNFYKWKRKEAYEKGCNIDPSQKFDGLEQTVGVSMSCFELGVIEYNDGKYKKALTAFKRACEYGESSGCKNVKYICKDHPSICKK